MRLRPTQGNHSYLLYKMKHMVLNFQKSPSIPYQEPIPTVYPEAVVKLSFDDEKIGFQISELPLCRYSLDGQ